MATVSIWSGVGVSVQSALGASKTITAITKASTGVASSTAHGLANGSFVLLTVQGMYQVNARVFRVANQAANTFELEGEDTTLYDTFVSGVANEITFGTTISTISDVSVSGGEFDKEDTTTIHDSTRSQIPTVAAPTVFAMTSIWDASDAALKLLVTATALKSTRAVRITFSNGQKYLFNGYPGITLAPGGTAQTKVTTPLSFDAQARGTFYAT